MRTPYTSSLPGVVGMSADLENFAVYETSSCDGLGKKACRPDLYLRRQASGRSPERLDHVDHAR